MIDHKKSDNSVISAEDYEYDDADSLMEKTLQPLSPSMYESRVTSITRSGITTNSNSYNGLDTRYSTTDSTGTKTFKRAGASVTATLVGDGSAVYTPGISERRSSTTTYLHPGIKSGEAQSSTSQVIGATRQYDAFGSLDSSTGTWKGPFGYGGPFGYQETGDHGLRLLGHRYYDSSTRRFLTRDLAKEGRNWYGYCSNNPIARVDPGGLDWHNPAVVGVDPGFNGKVWGVGEPDYGEEQVVVQIRPGYRSSWDMDIDLLVVVHPDGTKRYYFLMGIGYLREMFDYHFERREEYWVDENGDVHGALVIPWSPGQGGILSGQVNNWLNDIAKAKRRRAPSSAAPKRRYMLPG